jgi:shikimate dehydrogenase
VLLGNPVEHSRSPQIHRAALDRLGLAGSYEARAVDEQGVEEAFAAMRRGDVDGMNVTMPHKNLAARLCDRLDPPAARAESVNTVTREGDEIVGYSTDIIAIGELWDRFPAGAPVLVLGTGGAAAAAAVALGHLRLYLAGRRPGVTTELAARLGIDAGEVRWATPVVGAVVVNCTPLGMNGEPLPGPVVDLSAGLFDMAYGPAPTPAIRRSQELGLPAVTGPEMLVAQAAASFRLWTGRPAPVAEMAAAVENHSRP